jgi:hypothetical protein
MLQAGNPPPPYVSLAAAQQAGAVTLNYGQFLNNVFSFLMLRQPPFSWCGASPASSGTRRRRRRSRSQDLPLLPFRHRCRGDPLPALHLAASA